MGYKYAQQQIFKGMNFNYKQSMSVHFVTGLLRQSLIFF